MEASMLRCAVNISGAVESALFGSGETAFAARRRGYPSSFEFVIDDDASAPLGAPADATHHRLPHAAHYLFNSMPCAYAWFHH
jgi:hypothetical protein